MLLFTLDDKDKIISMESISNYIKVVAKCERSLMLYFFDPFHKYQCSVVEGTKVCYQNFIASYSKNTNFHQIYFWYKKQEWVDQYHSQPSAHIFILQ